MAKTNEMPETALKPPRQKGVWKDFWALMRGVKLGASGSNCLC